MRTHKTRVVKSISLWIGYMAVGMSLAMVGPTLLDLQQQVQTGITNISFVLTARAAGFVAGSLIMGLIYSRVNFLSATAFTFATSAGLTFAISYMEQLWSLLLVFIINGGCLGFFEAACNVSMLFLWGKEAVPFMQVLNFMYGTGAMIAPVIAEPFLFIKNETAINYTSTEPEVFHPEKVRLIYPYSIAAGLLAFSAAFNFVLYILYPVTTEHPSRQTTSHSGSTQPLPLEEDNNNSGNLRVPNLGRYRTISETGSILTINSHRNIEEVLKMSASMASIRKASCLTLPTICSQVETVISSEIDTKSYKRWKYLTLLLVFMFMHIYLGLEISFGSYLTTYVVNCDLNLTKGTGAHMTTLFWATFTFTKVATIFYIRMIGNQTNLLLSLMTMLAATILLNFYGNISVSLLWIGIALIGIGLSSVWGCMFGYLEEYFPVTSVIGSLMIVSAMLGEFVFPVIISSMIEKTPQILMWVVLFCSSSMTLLFLLIMFLCNRKLKHTQS